MSLDDGIERVRRQRQLQANRDAERAAELAAERRRVDELVATLATVRVDFLERAASRGLTAPQQKTSERVRRHRWSIEYRDKTHRFNGWPAGCGYLRPDGTWCDYYTKPISDRAMLSFVREGGDSTDNGPSDPKRELQRITDSLAARLI